MSGLRKLAFVLFPTFFFIVVFFLDVVRGAVTVLDDGMDYVRGSFILLAFVMLFFYFRSSRRGRTENVVREIGKLLVATLFVLFVVLLGTMAPSVTFVERDFALVPANPLTILMANVASIAMGILAILLLLTIRGLILHKRKKGIRRNFLIYLVLMLASAAVALPVLIVEVGFIGSILFGLAILMTIVNSFKQNWIVYLSRREKIYGIIYSLALALLLIVLLAVVTNRGFPGKAISYFSDPLERFVVLNMIFGAVYFGMAFLSTLFHLPTADVFERKQSELSSLHSLSRLVTQVLDFSDLVRTVTQMTREVCGARSSWLELVKKPSKEQAIEFDVVATNNITTQDIDTILSVPESQIRSLILESRKVLLIDSVSEDRRTKHFKGRKLEIGSLLSIPLMSQQTLIGILHATSEEAYGFDRDDIDVMTTFADQVRIAIENAKLIAQSLERERYHQEILLAQQMQKKLLPQKLPTHPAFEVSAISEPSHEVGGDPYDFVELGDERIGVVIGDVSGKGISAAFYMAEMKGIFQALSKSAVTPRDFVLQANEALTDSLDRKTFVSLLYAVFDLKNSTATIARAGHCPVIHVRGAGHTFIRPGGLGLGLTKDDLFNRSTEELSISLLPGDACIFYTDGVTEVRSPSGEEFGVERLVKSIMDRKGAGAETIRERVWDNIRRFAGDENFEDDLTLVVVKWHGEAEMSDISRSARALSGDIRREIE
ncbi:MAG: GAF domain-containing protein [Ignavibacteria bacterium]|nr:GAF domain-containing protein [Ignavibacteria bacterium]